MALALTALSSLLGFLGGGARLGSVQAAGQAQQEQATQLLLQNLALNQKTGKELNDASNVGVAANALAGKYFIVQNAQTSLLDTHLKVANKWMQVLGGQS